MRNTITTAFVLASACSHSPQLDAPDSGSTSTPDASSTAAWHNGDRVTVTPNGGVATFGAKTAAAPTLWDHGQAGAGVLDAQWTGGWPNAATNAVANLFNRTAPFQALGSTTIAAPTPYTDTFLAGNHYDVDRSTGGNGVMAFVAYETPAQPYYSYWNYYYRHDPNWWFTTYPAQVTFTGTLTAGSNVITGIAPMPTGLTTDSNAAYATGIPNKTAITNVSAGSATMSAAATASGTRTISVSYVDRDENTKLWDLSVDSSDQPYGATAWYYNQWDHPKTNTDPVAIALGQWEGIPAIPDQNGHNNYWGTVKNPNDPANGWIHVELVIKMSTDSTGFFRYYEDGVKLVDYAGPTTYASQRTVESIGGYARNQGPVGRVTPFTSTGAAGDYTQWRYYANLYNDRETSGLGRFLLVTDGTVTEVQPYVAYGADSVDLIINKGNLTSGPAQILFVDEAAGVAPTVVASGTLE